MGVDDIEGTKTGWRPRNQTLRLEKAPHDIMSIGDVVGGRWRSDRSGKENPLAPKYKVNGMAIEDDPIKTKPRKLPRQKNGPYLPLETRDIEGTRVSEMNLICYVK